MSGGRLDAEVLLSRACERVVSLEELAHHRSRRKKQDRFDHLTATGTALGDDTAIAYELRCSLEGRPAGNDDTTRARIRVL